MSKDFGESTTQTSLPNAIAVKKDIDFCGSLLTSLLHRSQSLEKRLQNEINLAIHLDAQHNGHVTSHIAELAQRDGEITKGISVLGMVFLPGTFVSAIFSMSFFDFPGPGQSQRLVLSSQFWLYWAIALPLTVLTLATWHLWQRDSVRRWINAVRYRYATSDSRGQGEDVHGA
ncbi:hypothetical protein LTR17_006134 [Elasticomyces elasticus]|nr:hypothetical protein LTR17_006134 [Elasticomyces elasticus]